MTESRLGLQPDEDSKQLPIDLEENIGLTQALLKAFPGCEHYTDKQAEEVISTLRLLAEILYDLPMQKYLHNVDYQLEIDLQTAVPENFEIPPFRNAA